MSAPSVELRARPGNAHSAPLFSVIVPTYRRHHTLERCVAALAAQSFPRDRYEVLIVDDGSGAPPRDVIERYADAMHVRLIEAEHAGPAAARNRGAAAARGTYLVFTDDDCIPAPHWLSAFATAVQSHPDRAVGGAVINALGDGMCSTASQLLVDFLYEYFNADPDGGRFFITANLAFPAESFRGTGGFDVTFPLAAAEDRDMCDRWREHGHEFTYCERAEIHHAHALTLVSFARQHFNYGRGAHHLHLARARRGVEEIVVEPPHFYSRLVSFPFKQGVSVRAFGLSALMLLTQMSYAIGYFTERLRPAPRRVTSSQRPHEEKARAQD